MSEEKTPSENVNKKPEMITAFAYESAMMHKDMDSERQHRGSIVFCVTIIIMTIIFVLAYTLRMNAFIDTINRMTAAIVELAGVKGIIAP